MQTMLRLLPLSALLLTACDSTSESGSYDRVREQQDYRQNLELNQVMGQVFRPGGMQILSPSNPGAFYAIPPSR